LLLNMHRAGEALPVLQQAKARDPMYFLVSAYLGTAEIDVGQITDGVAEERRGLSLEPRSVAALSTMARGYLVAAMPDSAIAVARRLVAVTQSPGRLGTAAFVLARSGQRSEAEAIIRRLEALPPGTWTRSSGLSMAYLGVQDTARTVAYMERAAAGDGDLFVLFSTLTAAEIPRSDRTDAVWRRFHLDPARMAAHAKVARD
jgi:hypothetical protein